MEKNETNFDLKEKLALLFIEIKKEKEGNVQIVQIKNEKLYLQLFSLIKDSKPNSSTFRQYFDTVVNYFLAEYHLLWNKQEECKILEKDPGEENEDEKSSSSTNNPFSLLYFETLEKILSAFQDEIEKEFDEESESDISRDFLNSFMIKGEAEEFINFLVKFLLEKNTGDGENKGIILKVVKSFKIILFVFQKLEKNDQILAVFTHAENLILENISSNNFTKKYGLLIFHFFCDIICQKKKDFLMNLFEKINKNGNGKNSPDSPEIPGDLKIALLMVLVQFAKDEEKEKMAENHSFVQDLRQSFLYKSEGAEGRTYTAENKKKYSIFILKVLVDHFVQNPELLELEKFKKDKSSPLLLFLEKEHFVKYWINFFQLFDVFDNTQLHIMQPFFIKLQDFKNPVFQNKLVISWQIVIWNKMINHQNKVVAKEGIYEFLQLNFSRNSKNTENEYKVVWDYFEDFLIPILNKNVTHLLIGNGEVFFEAAGVLANFLENSFPGFSLLEIILKTGKYLLKTEGLAVILFTIAYLKIKNSEIRVVPVTPEVNNQKNLENLENVLIIFNSFFKSNCLYMNKFVKRQLNVNLMRLFFGKIICKENLNFSIEKIMENLQNLENCPNFELLEKYEENLLTFMGNLENPVFQQLSLDFQMQNSLSGISGKFPEKSESENENPENFKFFENLRKFNQTQLLGFMRFLYFNNSPEFPAFVQDLICYDLENFNVLYANKIFSVLKGLIEENVSFNSSEILIKTVFKAYSNLSWTILQKDLDPDIFQLLLQILLFLQEKFGFLNFEIPENFDYNFISGDGKIQFSRAIIFLNLTLLLDKNKKLEKNLNENFKISNFQQFEQKFSSRRFANDLNFDSPTLNKLYSEFYLAKWKLLEKIIQKRAQPENPTLSAEILEKSAITVIDELDAAGPNGILFAMEFFIEIIKNFDNFLQDEKIKQKIIDFVQVAWSGVFELRRSDTFFDSMALFVQFIAQDYFQDENLLVYYGQKLLDETENILSIPLILVENLISTGKTREDIIYLLMKVAIHGYHYYKDFRSIYQIWNYMTENHLKTDREIKLNGGSYLGAFSKARVLATFYIVKCCQNPGNPGNVQLHSYIVNTLLEENEKELEKHRNYFVNSQPHRVRQRLTQLFLILQPFFSFELNAKIFWKIFECLVLDSPQPGVRYLFEWLVIKNLLEYPELHERFFEEAKKGYFTRFGFGSSAASLFLHTTANLKDGTGEELEIKKKFIEKSMNLLGILVLSQHVTTRYYSQVSFVRIYENSFINNGRLESLESFKNKYQVLRDSLIAQTEIGTYAAKITKLIENDFYVNHFHPIKHYFYHIIFLDLPKLSGMIYDELVQDSELDEILSQFGIQDLTPNSKEEVANLKILYAEWAKISWHIKAALRDGREIGEIEEEHSSSKSSPVSPVPAPTPVSSNTNSELNMQRKINPWKFVPISEELSQFTEEIQIKKREAGEKEGLIVVASLLDRTPNLGGLCRSCEIFGVSKYVIPTFKLLQDSSFQSLSVSSQNWLEIVEVRVDGLEGFLKTFSVKGYRIIGIEQTNNSVKLNDYKFPKKSVLLLGNEITGIPHNLLHLLDDCIEIPQVGVTRSLNVHMCGGICIYAYFSQHNL